MRKAICEAVGRPNMRFVPIKSIEQQAILSVHRVRQGFVKARTAQANQIRGLLGEFGLIIPQGIINVAKRVPELLEDASNELPVAFRQLIDRLTQHLKELDRQVKEFERQIIAWHRRKRAQPQAREDPRHRPAGRQRAGGFDRRCEQLRQRPAGLGLAGPGAAAKLQRRQAHAPGDEQTRRRVSAHAADPWGALGHPGCAKNKAENTNVWLANLLTRRHPNIAAVALANKNVRTVWALLAHGREFKGRLCADPYGRIAESVTDNDG